MRQKDSVGKLAQTLRHLWLVLVDIQGGGAPPSSQLGRLIRRLLKRHRDPRGLLGIHTVVVHVRASSTLTH